MTRDVLIINAHEVINRLMDIGFKKKEAQDMIRLIILAWMRYMIDVDYRFSLAYPTDFGTHFKNYLKEYEFKTTDPEYLLNVANHYLDDVVDGLHDFADILRPDIDVYVHVKDYDLRITYV